MNFVAIGSKRFFRQQIYHSQKFSVAISVAFKYLNDFFFAANLMRVQPNMGKKDLIYCDFSGDQILKKFWYSRRILKPDSEQISDEKLAAIFAAAWNLASP